MAVTAPPPGAPPPAATDAPVAPPPSRPGRGRLLFKALAPFVLTGIVCAFFIAKGGYR